MDCLSSCIIRSIYEAEPLHTVISPKAITDDSCLAQRTCEADPAESSIAFSRSLFPEHSVRKIAGLNLRCTPPLWFLFCHDR